MEHHNLKILIVEDEILLSFTMEEMLKDFGYNTISIANNYKSALDYLGTGAIELAILDINLGEGPGGLNLAKECFLKRIPFFYVTSYTDRKTLDLALETAPGSYVIKPVIPTNLYSAINLSLNKLKKESYFSFKDSVSTVKLKTIDILYLEADGIYLKIETLEKSYLSRMTLASAIEELPESEFVQTHRSYVVNLNKISKSKSNLIFIGKKQIPISRTFKDSFKLRYWV